MSSGSYRSDFHMECNERATDTDRHKNPLVHRSVVRSLTEMSRVYTDKRLEKPVCRSILGIQIHSLVERSQRKVLVQSAPGQSQTLEFRSKDIDYVCPLNVMVIRHHQFTGLRKHTGV